MRVASGSIINYLYFVAADATDRVTRETGLSSFTVYRSRNGAAEAAMTTPTIVEIDNTNNPGEYALLMDEDMVMANTNLTEEMLFRITHAGMAPVTRTVELFRSPIIRLGTAQAGADGTITADASASAVDDFYKGRLFRLTAGTGAGQVGLCTAYNGTSKVATMAIDWLVNPDNTTGFSIEFPGDANALTVDYASPSSAAEVASSVAALTAGGLSWNDILKFMSYMFLRGGTDLQQAVRQFLDENGAAAIEVTFTDAGDTRAVDLSP